MGIASFYFISLIPVAVGAVMMVCNRRIVWWEWVVGSLSGFVLSGIMHAVALHGMTGDVEMWSGRIERVVYHPEWVEEYQQMHTRSMPDGRGGTTTETYYTIEYRTHRRYWEAETTLDAFRIDEGFYNLVTSRLGGEIRTVKARKPGFHKGDPNLYSCDNQTGWLQACVRHPIVVESSESCAFRVQFQDPAKRREDLILAFAIPVHQWAAVRPVREHHALGMGSDECTARSITEGQRHPDRVRQRRAAGSQAPTGRVDWWKEKRPRDLLRRQPRETNMGFGVWVDGERSDEA